MQKWKGNSTFHSWRPYGVTSVAPPLSVLSPFMLTVAIMAHFSRRRQQMTIASCQIQKGEQKTKKEAPR